MIKNYLKIAIRNIFKQKIHSFINILGLAVGFAAFFLISLYVQFELSFDRYHEHADQIYRVVREEYANTPPALGPTLMKEFPEVIAVTRIIREENILFSSEEKHFEEKEYYWADPEVFEIFSIPIINGDPNEALKKPNTVLLSERMAVKYFGNEDPIGKILTMEGQYDFQVSGVFANMPENSHFRMNIILPAEKFFEVTGNNKESWGSNYLQTYFLLHKDADAKVLEDKFNPVFEEYVHNWYSKMQYKNYNTQPITEIHLYSHRQQEMEANNDIKYIILFSIIAFLILIIACINYMNLSAAQIIKRTNEVGLRKAIGANRPQLLMQFLGETLAIVLFAVIIALILIKISLPFFNNLVGKELSLSIINNLYFIVIIMSIVLVTSLFAGFFPALYISKFKPQEAMKGTLSIGSTKVVLRNILVLVQFSITILLIICTLTVKRQLNYIKKADMGFSRDQIINLRVIDKNIRNNIETIKTELQQNSNISSVSTSESLPNSITCFNRPGWLNENREEPIVIYYNTVSYDFIDVFDIEIIEGRNFSRDFPSDQNGAFLINEAAAKATQWESVIGKEIYYWSGERGPIVGIMKDFHLQSVHSPIVPLYFLLKEQRYSYISIKLASTNLKETIDFIESVFRGISPNTPFNYTFFNDDFEKSYLAEQKLATVFNLFSYLAIVLACLGLFGLAAFSTTRREKEIAIRKVSGASISSISILLSKEFIRWVVLANIIAWPIAYYLIKNWLQSFAYKATISWWIFVLSGIVAILIAILTVSFHTIRAATNNPADRLRYE